MLGIPELGGHKRALYLMLPRSFHVNWKKTPSDSEWNHRKKKKKINGVL